MPEEHDTASARAGKSPKPNKPYPEFPLFPHATKRWAKKIRGVTHYFGPWADPDGALKKYMAEKDALHAGRKPREVSAGVTVKDVCNQFLNTKKAAVESGELTQRSWEDYKSACEVVIAHFGKSRLADDVGPDDFAAVRATLTKRLGPVSLGNTIQRVRSVFKFATDNGLVTRPVLYGQSFKRPTRKTIRVERAKKGPKLFSAAEVRAMIDGATVRVGDAEPELVRPGRAVRAMVLLGINCGFGNADCGRLPRAAVDLDRGVIDYPRPKTGIPRRCVLWPETVAAIREAGAARPEPTDPADADLVFVTKYGRPWAKDTADSTLAKEFKKLLRALRIDTRKGVGFYTLRHTFRTAADESKDQPAVDYVMGHEVAHMSSHYRETISDERLKAVADHVRKWVFGGAE